MKSEVNDAGSGFEEIEHTADWALRIRGRDLRGTIGQRGLLA